MKSHKALSVTLTLAATLGLGALSMSKASACGDLYGCGHDTYQQVLVRPAQTFARVLPAQYRLVTENYVVEPGYRVARTIPPIYRTVTERVLVQPSREIAESVGAVTRTYAELVPVRVSFGCGCDERIGYETQYRTVEVRPASVVYHRTPAVYATQTRQVEARSEQTVYETVAPVYGHRTRAVEVEPERTIYQTFPAEYRTYYQPATVVDTDCGCSRD